MARYDVLIVGAGHGGAQAAIALRQQKFEGSIAIVGDESEFPYERPPLSKEYLSGDKEFDRILIRPIAFWAQRDIAMLLGRRVQSIDPGLHTVELEDGGTLEYGALVWAAGGSPRSLSCAGGDLKHVHTVRNRADVDRMLAELPETDRAVVVGGGYIGLEAAAVLTKLGKQVILLEALDRVLARVAGEEVSRFYESEHRAKGVDLRTGVTIDCLVDEGGIAVGVRLADGSVLPADMVIVGIGIVPAVAPLAGAGAAVTNGVEVDELCRTSLPDVYAVGDCAAHKNLFADGNRVRLESVQNASDQATTVAKSIMGSAEPYSAVPWFWSNQYDLKLQTVGLSSGHDRTVIRGDPASRSFSAIYLREGRVIALDCINATRDYVQGRKLIVDRASPPPERLADCSAPLKEL